MKKKQYKNYYTEEDELDQYTLHLDETEKYVSVKRFNGKKGEDGVKLWYYVGFASDLGFTIALPIVGGALAGYLIDSRWSTSPRATLLFLFIGIIVSVAGFVRILKELMQKKN